MSKRQRILKLLGSDRTADEQELCRLALHAILRGEAAQPAELASEMDLSLDKIEAMICRLAARGLVVIESGGSRIVGSWGLSLAPSEHRLRIRGRELFTWCAADAVGIPAGLGEDAIVVSHCRQCGAPLRIEMLEGKAARAGPADIQVWIAPSQAGRSVVGCT